MSYRHFIITKNILKKEEDYVVYIKQFQCIYYLFIKGIPTFKYIIGQIE